MQFMIIDWNPIRFDCYWHNVKNHVFEWVFVSCVLSVGLYLQIDTDGAFIMCTAIIDALYGILTLWYEKNMVKFEWLKTRHE